MDNDKLEEFPYGEDNFLVLEDFVEPIADKSVMVKFVDLEKESNFFDAVHLTPSWCSKDSISVAEQIVQKYCSDAKIINSAFDPGSFHVLDGHTGDNTCEFLPAIYDGYSPKMGSN